MASLVLTTSISGVSASIDMVTSGLRRPARMAAVGSTMWDNVGDGDANKGDGMLV